MIAVTKIIERIEAALDAEGFGRYTFNEDYKPAINQAKDFIVSVYNKVMSENKLSESAIRELRMTRVWTTSNKSRLSLSSVDVGASIWDILGIYLDITYDGNLNTTYPDTPEISIFRPNANYLKSSKSARRITNNQANRNRNNPFSPGSEKETCDELIDYGYVLYDNYAANYTPSPLWEIQIVPDYKRQLAAVDILKYPVDITATTDNLPFPEFVLTPLVSKALSFISFKQGDATNLYTVSERETAVLMQLLV
jgi:hypothetical protein